MSPNGNMQLSLSLGSQVGGAGGIFGKKQEGMLSSGTDVDPTLVTNCSICEYVC